MNVKEKLFDETGAKILLDQMRFVLFYFNVNFNGAFLQ